MAKKKTPPVPPVPPELAAFIKDGKTTFHCDDGDWELMVQSRDDSEFKDELPPRSTMIAENGSGDCLFLKTSPADKIDAKVFVYWHEEERSEMFAKNIEELIAASAKNQAAAAKAPKPAKTPATKSSISDVEKRLKAKKGHERWAVLRELCKAEYGLEALPLLRRTLAEDDASMVIHSAECVAKLGPEAATCPAGEADQPIAESGSEKGDLLEQLRLRGAKIWSYSGYANAYSACIDALVKLEYEPDFLIEYVQTHIGLGTDALLDSLEALSSVGTSDARDLAKRAVTFWTPELNASEKKKATAILASFDKSKKAKK